MAKVAPGVVVLIAIIAAAAVVAVAAAMHKVYGGRSTTDKSHDVEATDAMVMNFSNEQLHYMRDVRMRGQLNAYGLAPAYGEDYQPPRSQIGRGGPGTETSFGFG
ncbi:hypothetical protein LTS08_002168 [Lithohypha guttulata]|uniref:Uncharacterized protein n=1 Tax=Lithohypha guttulata TaxID=1690604 RepID=A0AAN7T716_9EURO|nr:hypothetical protein LTR51_004315 [Lithohypha guttulata]KAK5090922.1 hypothetical protein LTR05_001100 [Lithohypha guttulata]KAK5104281.1 hypothetical protein LTS08_002168 [Lithohypha guttulata]